MVLYDLYSGALTLTDEVLPKVSIPNILGALALKTMLTYKVSLRIKVA